MASAFQAFIAQRYRYRRVVERLLTVIGVYFVNCESSLRAPLCAARGRLASCLRKIYLFKVNLSTGTSFILRQKLSHCLRI